MLTAHTGLHKTHKFHNTAHTGFCLLRYSLAFSFIHSIQNFTKKIYQPLCRNYFTTVQGRWHEVQEMTTNPHSLT